MAIELKLATPDTPEPWQAAGVAPPGPMPAAELDYAREGLPNAEPKAWWRSGQAIARRIASRALGVLGGALNAMAVLLLAMGNSVRYVMTGAGNGARYLLSGAGDCSRSVLAWTGNRAGRGLTKTGMVVDYLLTASGNVARVVFNGAGIIARCVLAASGITVRSVLAGAANLLLLMRRASFVGLYHRLRWGRVIDAELA